ncbi:MAG TPA: Nramp family divalent metal transporter [Gemmatimonadaceae bacterium]|jgi:Mn2+/Fe2+ NRAMP family transporter|nr:Nramp family divalent metal transporter [Gemmatimonadaceae bacterium]
MRLPRLGPGALVTAAFIGPGTVTTCTLAGVQFGTALLWALLFATLGTIILQEMSARLGTVAGVGLGDAVRAHFVAPLPRLLATGLIAAAIGVGNAAYQTGNLLGAALGAQVVAGGSMRAWVLGLAIAASALLWRGSYRVLERVLVGMVIVMSVVFLATAMSLPGDLTAIVRDALRPTMPAGSAIVALGLVGTTIVPYNLFLHASAARLRFQGEGALGEARLDLVVAIALGGLVSMAIVVTAAASGATSVPSAAAMATQLEPLLGSWARHFFGMGLLAAGLTSAITAPLAAGYALAGAFGWPADLRDRRLRLTWGLVMLTGTAFALAGVRPLPAIVFAQAANGLLLPAIAVFLLVVLNDRQLLGRSVNGPLANVLGATVTLLAAFLGARAVVGAVLR